MRRPESPAGQQQQSAARVAVFTRAPGGVLSRKSPGDPFRPSFIMDSHPPPPLHYLLPPPHPTPQPVCVSVKFDRVELLMSECLGRVVLVRANRRPLSFTAACLLWPCPSLYGHQLAYPTHTNKAAIRGHSPNLHTGILRLLAPVHSATVLYSVGDGRTALLYFIC